MSALLFPADRLGVSREYYEARRPWTSGLALWVLLLLFITVLVWAAVFEIEEIVRGSVTVRPLERVSTVLNPVAGTVRTVACTDGASVAEGALLYEIDTSETDAQLAVLEPQIAEDTLRLEQLRLAYQAFTGTPAQPITDPEFSHRVAEYHLALRHYELQLEEKTRRLRNESGTPGLYANREAIEQLQAEISLISVEHDQYRESGIAGILADIADREGELRAKERDFRALVSRRERSHVLSSVRGTVQFQRDLNEGDRLAQDEYILQVVPVDEKMVRVKISLAARDIAGIRPGSPVRIHFFALPPSEFGYAQGTIITVPADAHVSGNGPPVFELEGSISAAVRNKSRSVNITIQPGMDGEARIVRRRKSVLSFLLALMDFRNRQ